MSDLVKHVHVDNDTIQVLNIILQKHMGDNYDSNKVPQVALDIFNSLPSFDPSPCEKSKECYIFGLEEFEVFVRNWAIGQAASASNGSGSPSSQEKRGMEKEDAKKTDAGKAQDYQNTINFNAWECVNFKLNKLWAS